MQSELVCYDLMQLRAKKTVVSKMIMQGDSGEALQISAMQVAPHSHFLKEDAEISSAGSVVVVGFWNL